MVIRNTNVHHNGRVGHNTAPLPPPMAPPTADLMFFIAGDSHPRTQKKTENKYHWGERGKQGKDVPKLWKTGKVGKLETGNQSKLPNSSACPHLGGGAIFFCSVTTPHQVDFYPPSIQVNFYFELHFPIQRVSK